MAAIGVGPGGIGFRKDGDTALLLRFAESDDNVFPSDDVGNLGDMFQAPGQSLPTVASAEFGYGRSFAGGAKGFDGTELVPGALRLVRDVTIEAIVNFEGGRQTGLAKTIISRGNEDGTDAEKRLWSAKLLGGTSLLQGKIGVEWRDASGLNAITTASEYLWPREGIGFFYVAIVRRWIASNSLAFDFYMNGELLETVTSTAGDISGGVGGTTTVGYADDSVTPKDFFFDIIDQIRVSNRARTAEEIEHFHQEMFVLPGYALELVRSLLPPGKTYSEDPDSAIQRELAVEADVLALAWSDANELRDDMLPERATRILSVWEEMTRLFPKPGDTVASRRERVLGHLRTIHGFNIDQIRNAVTGLLDLQVALIEILENSNRFIDEFPLTSLIDAWQMLANETLATATVATGTLTLALGIGDNSVWTEDRGPPVLVRTSIIGEEAEIVVGVEDALLGTAGDAFGLVFSDVAKNEHHLFGIINEAGNQKWFQELITPAGVTRTIYAASPTLGGGGGGTVYLRMLRNADDTVDLQWDGDGTGDWWGPWNDIALAQASVTNNDWAGIFVKGDSTSLGAASNAEFEEFRAWMPKMRDVYRWFLYRNPAEFGVADIPGAQSVVNRLKPAHTIGHVVESKVFICDSATDLCDREPVA